jgi:MFS family permease
MVGWDAMTVTVRKQVWYRPLAASFSVFGVFWGSWAIAVADVKSSLHASDAMLGVLLAVAVLTAAPVNAASGGLVERWGSARVLSVGMTGWALAVLVSASMTSRLGFALAFIVTVAIGGSVDTVMNVAATAGLSDQPGQLMRFHAFFNGGAVLGAAATGIILRAGGSWRSAWIGIGLAALVTSFVVHRVSLPGDAGGEPARLMDGLRELRRERLVVLAIVFACAALVEGGIETWGVLFLRERLEVGVLVGAGAYVAGQSLATATRATLGPATGTLGARRAVFVAGSVASAGLLLEALSPIAALSAAGLAIAAMGVSACWPMLLATASGRAERSSLVVGGVTSVGYLGFVIGPPLVGGIAGAWGLRAGLVTLAAIAAFVAVGPGDR